MLSDCCCVQSLSHVLTLYDPCGLKPARLLCPWDFPGKNTRVRCHFLLQRIFPSQGWNLCILHRQVGSLPLHHPGSPRVATLTQQSSQSHVFMGNTELLNFGVLCFIQQTQFSIKIETHLSFFLSFFIFFFFELLSLYC